MLLENCVSGGLPVLPKSLDLRTPEKSFIDKNFSQILNSTINLTNKIRTGLEGL